MDKEKDKFYRQIFIYMWLIIASLVTSIELSLGILLIWIGVVFGVYDVYITRFKKDKEEVNEDG